MNRGAVLSTMMLVCGALLGPPAAAADPGCAPIVDPGSDNPAILLRDVQMGSDEDSDWISFIFDNSVKGGPEGGVLYWGVPAYTIAPTAGLGYTVSFKGGVAHSAYPRDRPYPGGAVTAPAEFPILGQAAQVSDGDYDNKNSSLVWGVSTKTPRCPVAEFQNIPPRLVVEFPH